MTWVLQLIVTILAFPAGRSVDIVSSLNFPAYGMYETNATADNPDGSLNMKSALIVSAIVEAALLVVFFAVSPLLGMLCSLLIGAMAVGRGLLNFQKKRKRRREQEKVLDGRFWYGQTFITNHKTGRSYIGLFPWLYSTNPDNQTAMNEVHAKLEEFRVNRNYPG